jgi:hypothetical protein
MYLCIVSWYIGIWISDRLTYYNFLFKVLLYLVLAYRAIAAGHEVNGVYLKVQVDVGELGKLLKKTDGCGTGGKGKMILKKTEFGWGTGGKNVNHMNTSIIYLKSVNLHMSMNTLFQNLNLSQK